MAVEEEIGSRVEEKKSDEVSPRAVDLIAAVFVLRGLINLLYPVFFGSSFNEYYEFLGDVYPLLLNLSSVAVGLGILKRTRWGYLSGLAVAAFSFLSQADPNDLERIGGHILSLLVFFGLMKTKSFFTERKRFDNLVAVAFTLILLGSAVWGATQPSKGEIYDYYRGLALEKNDPMICKKIGRESGVDQCITDVAVYMNNISICDIIRIKESRQICYDDVT